jgi:hypothetical protein
MPGPENPRSSIPRSTNEPISTTALPDTLAVFFKDQQLAALLHATENLGTIVIAKAPTREIQSLVGSLPIGIDQRLIAHPNAPVIRTVVSLYDRPDNPLRFEMFTNIGNAEQREEFKHS